MTVKPVVVRGLEVGAGLVVHGGGWLGGKVSWIHGWEGVWGEGRLDRWLVRWVGGRGDIWIDGWGGGWGGGATIRSMVGEVGGGEGRLERWLGKPVGGTGY